MHFTTPKPIVQHGLLNRPELAMDIPHPTHLARNTQNCTSSLNLPFLLPLVSRRIAHPRILATSSCRAAQRECDNAARGILFATNMRSKRPGASCLNSGPSSSRRTKCLKVTSGPLRCPPSVLQAAMPTQLSLKAMPSWPGHGCAPPIPTTASKFQLRFCPSQSLVPKTPEVSGSLHLCVLLEFLRLNLTRVLHRILTHPKFIS